MEQLESHHPHTKKRPRSEDVAAFLSQSWPPLRRTALLEASRADHFQFPCKIRFRAKAHRTFGWMGRGNSGPASPTHRQCPLRVCTRKEPCDLAALACGAGPRWDLSIEGRVLHHNSNPDTVSSISDLQRRAWGGPAHPHSLSLSKDSILRGFDVMVHNRDDRSPCRHS